MSLRITVEDLETGETETRTIENDWVLICHGNKYLANTSVYPTKGTAVLTVKTDQVGESE